MRLTKLQTKLHDESIALAKCGRRLSFEEKEFIWENFHPAATHNTTKTGAFFTPSDFAWEAACQHGGGGHVVDFCAGIGVLAGVLLQHTPAMKITCIEQNPEYLRIGRVLVPEAEWIEGDALAHARRYDSAISNPPFGRIQGVNFELEAINWITRNTDRGAILILPEDKYKAPQGWEVRECPCEASSRFKVTGIRVKLYDLGPT